MKIGVVADTQGSLSAWNKVEGKFLRQDGRKRIVAIHGHLPFDPLLFKLDDNNITIYSLEGEIITKWK